MIWKSYVGSYLYIHHSIARDMKTSHLIQARYPTFRNLFVVMIFVQLPVIFLIFWVMLERASD